VRANRYVRNAPFRATARLVFVDLPGSSPITNQPGLLGPDGDGLPGRHGRPDGGPGHGPDMGREPDRVLARNFLSAPEGFSQQVVPQAGLVRLLVRRETVGGLAVRLGVGTPVQPTDRAKDVVRNAFLLAALAGLLTALLGGALVAQRVAAPLRRMAGVAAEVDEGDLGRRMGDTGRSDEVGRLARSFDTMLGRLEDAFARQGAFVADASHELRTPLTVIRGQLEVLGMQDDPPADEVRRVERVVRTEVDRMGRLVDDLLLLSAAGGGEFLRPTPVDLPDFLRDVLEGMRHTAARRFELGPVPPVVLDADPDRLAQALRNLISNAIAHTEEGGLVRLGAEVDGGRLRLSVDDDGPGIPEAERIRIFDRFHRVGIGRGDGGAGLGLSIVKAIAEAHGGRVDAGASPKGGARLTLDLPLS
jgi:signal transduction histidine kinase